MNSTNSINSKYRVVIGLEVHIQLNTKTKAFCGCSTEFGKPPNTLTCPVCLGFPGSLPVLNRKALELAIKCALALNCSIQRFVKFDRKNYFYPDLPKNYQISQYDLPLAREGNLELDKKKIRIRRVHLEEDAGKLIHQKDYSLVDFNRCGIPLLEIVSEPDIDSPQQAYDYLLNLRSILRYIEASTCDMEKGTLRCDANISISKVKTLGVKVELKNMNTFKGVRDALEYESRRQMDLIKKGKKIIQETRFWDQDKKKTISMRTKESAQDYRYFPEPDLVPFEITEEQIQELKKSLPELPKERRNRFLKEFNLSPYDSSVLTSEKKLADFFEDCLKIYSDAKNLCNWITTSLLAEINRRNTSVEELNLEPEKFVKLIRLTDEGRLSNLSAKEVLKFMLDSGKDPEEISYERDIFQIKDLEFLKKIVNEVLQENQNTVSDYLKGKEKAISFLIGQVMKKSKGKIDPKMAGEVLKERLKEVR